MRYLIEDYTKDSNKAILLIVNNLDDLFNILQEARYNDIKIAVTELSKNCVIDWS